MYWSRFITGISISILASLANAKLIYNFDFEQGNIFEWGAGPGNILNEHSVKIVSDPVRTGKFSAQLELKKSDQPAIGKRHRAELYIRPTGGQNEERWFGFSIFLPLDFVKDKAPEVIAQWKADPDEGEMERSPNIELRVQDDKFMIYKVWDELPKSSELAPHQTLLWQAPMGDLKGQWIDWVFHVRWDYKQIGKGLIEVWQNKNKFFSHEGPTGCNDVKPTYFKWGIYKWKWDTAPDQSQTSERILFLDSFKMGDEKSNFDEVSPQLPRAPSGKKSPIGK